MMSPLAVPAFVAKPAMWSAWRWVATTARRPPATCVAMSRAIVSMNPLGAPLGLGWLPKSISTCRSPLAYGNDSRKQSPKPTLYMRIVGGPVGLDGIVSALAGDADRRSNRLGRRPD